MKTAQRMNEGMNRVWIRDLDSRQRQVGADGWRLRAVLQSGGLDGDREASEETTGTMQR